MKRATAARALLIIVGLLSLPGRVAAQQTAGGASQPPAIDDTITAGEADDEEPARKLVKFNEFAGPLGSIRVGVEFHVGLCGVLAGCQQRGTNQFRDERQQQAP